MVDTAIHWINLYARDNAAGFPNTYPLDSNLLGYPTLEQLGPVKFQKALLATFSACLVFAVLGSFLPAWWQWPENHLTSFKTRFSAKIFRGKCVKQQYALPKLIFPEVEWGGFKPKNPLLGEYVWVLIRRTYSLMKDTTVVVVWPNFRVINCPLEVSKLEEGPQTERNQEELPQVSVPTLS